MQRVVIVVCDSAHEFNVGFSSFFLVRFVTERHKAAASAMIII